MGSSTSRYFFGLGANDGARRTRLRGAVQRLSECGLDAVRCSPVLETPALLPADAPAGWNRPFLNLVVVGSSTRGPDYWRDVGRDIEHNFGRDRAVSNWAPRPIDIDLLLSSPAGAAAGPVTLYDPELSRRSFLLVPLLHLEPGLRLDDSASLLSLTAALPLLPPLWMGIVNLTPDSFSDGGRHSAWRDVERTIDEMLIGGVHIIDFGAESTRPGARPLTAEEEWARLEPAIGATLAKLRDDPLRPRISVDTYHVETATRALAIGVDIINDVGGLNDPAMIRLAAAHPETDWIAMHQLGLPADTATTISADQDPFVVVEHWLGEQIERWQRAGVNLQRLVFDPGIGFGKDGLQSLQLMRRVSDFRRHGLRVLIGHSRKSYMRHFSQLSTSDKDQVTVGASLALCAQGVDILRVHNVPAHTAAYRGWAHLQCPT